MLENPSLNANELKDKEPEMYQYVIREISIDLYKNNPKVHNKGLEGFMEIVEKLIERGELRVMMNADNFWAEKYNHIEKRYEKLRRTQ